MFVKLLFNILSMSGGVTSGNTYGCDRTEGVRRREQVTYEIS